MRPLFTYAFVALFAYIGLTSLFLEPGIQNKAVAIIPILSAIALAYSQKKSLSDKVRLVVVLIGLVSIFYLVSVADRLDYILEPGLFPLCLLLYLTGGSCAI